MAVIDVGKFHRGKKDSLIENSDSEIRSRRAMSLTHLSKCIFHPPQFGWGRGKDSFIPDKHQLIPLDSFLNPWMGGLISADSQFPEDRKSLILADEGGMGKTYSSLLVALHYYNDYKKRGEDCPIIIICPPLLIKDWAEAFRIVNIKLRRKAADCLINGEIEDGFTIISKGGLPKCEFTNDSYDFISNCVKLCIVDEGHHGMITDDDPVLRDILSGIIKNSERSLIVTATPMRKNWKDLRNLLCSIIDNTEDIDRLNNFNPDNNWINRLKNSWLPNLDKLREGNLTNNDIQTLLDNIDMMIFLDPQRYDDFRTNLRACLDNYQLMSQLDRTKLARDLHPFGKYMSISIRDDLGRNNVLQSYREKYSRTIKIPDWNELEELEEYIEIKYGKKHSSRHIIRSCPRNCLSEGYAMDGINKTDGQIIELANKATDNDPRLDKLREICEDTMDNHPIGKKCAVVVFCRYKGTVKELSRWGKENNYDVYDLIEEEGEDELTQSKKMTILEGANRSSLNNQKLTIMICGPNASVGLNMQWANRVVHWDMEYKSIEMVSQKTWRLDRRWDSSRNDVMKEFKVTYLVLEKDENKAKEANKQYEQNRIFIGDRRFIGSANSSKIFDLDDDDYMKESWTLNPRDDSLTHPDMLKVWSWRCGNVPDVSGIAEGIWLRILNDLFDLGLDIDGDTPDTEINVMLLRRPEERNEFFYNLHHLITMAGASERGALQFLGGGYQRVSQLMKSYGVPNIDTNRALLGLLPDGVLASKIISLLRQMYDQEIIKFDHYPYFVEHYEEEIAYAIHLGVLDFVDSSIGRIFSNYLKGTMLSGLIIREGGVWKHISISELENHISIFEILEESADINECYSHLPITNLEDERTRFLNSPEMKDFREKFDYEKMLEEGTDFSNDDLISLIRTPMNVRNIEERDFLPIIIFSQHENARESDICPICGIKTEFRDENGILQKISHDQETDNCQYWSKDIERGWI